MNLLELPSWANFPEEIVEQIPNPWDLGVKTVQQERKEFRVLYGGYGSADTKTNARVKVYLEKVTLQVSNSNIFPTADWEKPMQRDKYEPPYNPLDGEMGVEKERFVPVDKERSIRESKRRAKSKVRDIALCNRFQFMFTWTLDPKKVDRTDSAAVYAKVRGFLTNMTQRKGFTYVAMPEYHKLKSGEDKPGIHFHGLCSLGGVCIERSMKRNRPRLDKNQRPVYNMTDWSLGWSTVVPLDGDYERAVNYITKYITKQDTKILGKYYLSSRSLKKSPDIIPIDDGVPFYGFRDDEKIDCGKQYESTVFRDIKIVSEDFEKGDDWK